MYTFFLKIKACLPSLASMLKTLNDKNLFCFKKKRVNVVQPFFYLAKKLIFFQIYKILSLKFFPCFSVCLEWFRRRVQPPAVVCIFTSILSAVGMGWEIKKRKPFSC